MGEQFKFIDGIRYAVVTSERRCLVAQRKAKRLGCKFTYDAGRYLVIKPAPTLPEWAR